MTMQRTRSNLLRIEEDASLLPSCAVSNAAAGLKKDRLPRSPTNGRGPLSDLLMDAAFQAEVALSPKKDLGVSKEPVITISPPSSKKPQAALTEVPEMEHFKDDFSLLAM